MSLTNSWVFSANPSGFKAPPLMIILILFLLASSTVFWIRSLPVLVGIASNIGLQRIVLQLQSCFARGFEKDHLPAR